MMKKRILASSMASVMALSSVSVVAFADEKKDYGEAVSKADLQAYIDSLDDFIATDLDAYGSVQGEKFQAAVDHAKYVLEDSKSVATDYSAAYQMVKAVKEKLVVKTAAELEALIKENKSKYEKNNIMNEEIQDHIYSESTYAKFTAAYDDADRYVDSADSRLITDAYIALEDAVKGLSELDSISKADFRAALKSYEAITLEMKNYESWRRGTITVTPSTGTSKNKDNLKKCAITLAQLSDIVAGSSVGNYTYWDSSKNKTQTVKAAEVSTDDKNDGHTDSEGKWIGSYDLTIVTDLATTINNQYDRFDDIKSAVNTTDAEIVAACKAALDAVDVFKGWTPDSYKSGSKSSCATLEKKYHSQLVETYNTTDISAVTTAIEGLTAASGSYVVTSDTDKHTLKSNKSFAIIKDTTTGLIRSTSDVYADATAATTALAGASGYAVQKISAGTNILTYLDYTVGSSDAALEQAFENYDIYLAIVSFKDDTKNTATVGGSTANIAAAQAIMDGLADGKTIPTVSGSTSEWTLIWRKLAYALEDKFPVESKTTYTLAGLKALYEKAYTLADETGDSAVFATVHQGLVDARQDAITFYTEAKATTGYKVDDTLDTDIDIDGNGDGDTLAEVYDALKKKVEEVEKWAADFKYSYGDIRTKIGEIAVAIDDGKVAGDALKKALAQCAYDLSVLEASAIGDTAATVTEDNYAFDGERAFQDVNRLKTNNKKQAVKPNDFEKNLLKSYEALVKAYDAAKNADAGVKNDFNGDGAFNVKDVDALIDALLDGKTDSKYDVDGNGTFNVKDVDALIDVLLA